MAVWCSPPNDWGLSPEKVPKSFPRLRTFETSFDEKNGFVYIVNGSLMHFQLTFMVLSDRKAKAPVSPGTINIHTIIENSLLVYKQSHKNL